MPVMIMSPTPWSFGAPLTLTPPASFDQAWPSIVADMLLPPLLPPLPGPVGFPLSPPQPNATSASQARPIHLFMGLLRG
ncbi:MAG: hypothetical protein U0527_08920 [Candidatus Eisenbacteria bacterium]